jgi:hypothetical protein
MEHCPACGTVSETDREGQSAIGFSRDCEPAFLARKGVLSREYHVLVVWPDGRRTKVGRFFRRMDAAHWIAQKSRAWLSQNLMTPNLSLDLPEQRSA